MIELVDGPPPWHLIARAVAAYAIVVAGFAAVPQLRPVSVFWLVLAARQLVIHLLLRRHPRRWLLGSEGLVVRGAVGARKVSWRQTSPFTLYRLPLLGVPLVGFRARTAIGPRDFDWPLAPLRAPTLAVYTLDADHLVDLLNQHRDAHRPGRPDQISSLWQLGHDGD